MHHITTSSKTGAFVAKSLFLLHRKNYKVIPNRQQQLMIAFFKIVQYSRVYSNFNTSFRWTYVQTKTKHGIINKQPWSAPHTKGARLESVRDPALRLTYEVLAGKKVKKRKITCPCISLSEAFLHPWCRSLNGGS